jgi:hypothetical protein
MSLINESEVNYEGSISKDWIVGNHCCAVGSNNDAVKNHSIARGLLRHRSKSINDLFAAIEEAISIESEDQLSRSGLD